MPIDTSPSKVATNALQAIPFSSLIGGPLNACVEAQAQAAMTSWEFIRNVGLTPDGKEAINVTFSYVKDGQSMNLVVPLLTIVPIPYIAIDDITIDFKANISASSSTISENSSSSEFGGKLKGSTKLGLGPFSIKADFAANYSSKKDSKATSESKYSVEYTMDIHVHAGQASMPAGLSTVLNILQASIGEAKPGGTLDVSPSPLAIKAQQDSFSIIQSTPADSQGMRPPQTDIQFQLNGIPGGIVMESMKADKGTVSGTPSDTVITIATDDQGEASAILTVKSVDPTGFTADVQQTMTITATVDGKALSKTVKVDFLKQ